ncbi:MAG: DUF5615 family PIN-like protein [Pseudobdellovibrionaceae bacterium]
MGLQRRKFDDKNHGARTLIGRLCAQGTGEERDVFFLVKEGAVRVPLHGVIANILQHPRMLPSAEGLGLLLDENTSPQAVLPLSSLFGWSSHVECEGLAGKKTPDTDIWRFAIDSGFRGFVTRDGDFLKVPLFTEFQQAARHSPVPFLVYVRGNLDGDRLVGLLQHHASDIQTMMNCHDQEACEIVVGQGQLRPLTLS